MVEWKEREGSLTDLYRLRRKTVQHHDLRGPSGSQQECRNQRGSGPEISCLAGWAILFAVVALCFVEKSEAQTPLVKPICSTPLLVRSPLHEAEYEAPGRSVKHWALEDYTTEQLELLFDNMQRDGIEIILLPVMFGEDVYYPSQVLPNPQGKDLPTTIFDLAESHGMKVVISGISHTYHLMFQGKAWDVQADIEMNKRIFQEMFERYGDRPSFWGFYIPHETGDRTHRGDIMSLLRELPPMLKRLAPGKKVIHSPWFTSRLTVGSDATTPAEFATEWDAMLSEIEGIDIFAIQDSTAPHEEIGEWFAAASPVFLKHGVELWSVVELFQREPQFSMARAANPEQVLEKMKAAAPYVKNFACWEYQNYLNPQAQTSGSKELASAYRSYFGFPEQRVEYDSVSKKRLDSSSIP